MPIDVSIFVDKRSVNGCYVNYKELLNPAETKEQTIQFSLHCSFTCLVLCRVCTEDRKKGLSF